jgi:hypothetical protein
MDETSWKLISMNIKTIAERGADRVVRWLPGDPKYYGTAIATVDAAGIELSVLGCKNENARDKHQQPGIVAIGPFSDCWKWGGRQNQMGHFTTQSNDNGSLKRMRPVLSVDIESDIESRDQLRQGIRLLQKESRCLKTLTSRW